MFPNRPRHGESPDLAANGPAFCRDERELIIARQLRSGQPVSLSLPLEGRRIDAQDLRRGFERRSTGHDPGDMLAFEHFERNVTAQERRGGNVGRLCDRSDAQVGRLENLRWDQDDSPLDGIT